MLVVSFPLVIWNGYLFSLCIKRIRNIWHMIYCQCVAIYLLLEHNIFLWQIILCLALFREKTLWESRKQHIPHLDHWEQCPGRSVLGIVLDMNTGHYFYACSASSSMSTHSHTFAFILHAHQAHPFCFKPLQTHFWSLCWVVSNGCCWQWKRITSMPPEDSTLWGSFSGLKQKDSLIP